MDISELQKDLLRKYRNVGSKVDKIWRAFTPQQRETCMRESTGDGQVLRHSADPGLGGLKFSIPEWNLKDITSDPGHFMTHFKFRATELLEKQLYEGVRGMPGDRLVAQRAPLRIRQHITRGYSGEMMSFLTGQNYGQCFRSSGPDGDRMLSEIDNLASVLLPRAEGEMIMHRQECLFILFNALVEEILDLDSETRAKKEPKPKKANKALVTAVSNLSIEPRALKVSISEIIGQAIEQKDAQCDYLDLLRSEPVVLNQLVTKLYYSRPELVPDERGRILPLLTDRYISTAFFEGINAAVRVIAIWEHIIVLLRLLENLDDKVKRPLILQELSNVCHLEFRRAQDAFKR